MHTRIADDLSRAFARLGVPADITASEGSVTVPSRAAAALLSRLAFIEGGARVPFVRALLRVPAGADVVLHYDQGLHLARALADIEQQKARREKIDRGQIPGALSGAEVSRLARRHPHLFG